MHFINQQLELALNFLGQLTHLHGFCFYYAKTVALHLGHLQGLYLGPNLNINGHPLPVLKTAYFQYLLFDRYLT